MANIWHTQGSPLIDKLYGFTFGRVDFEEGAEYKGFQYKFLIFLMLAGAVLTGLLVMGSLARLNPIDGPHLVMMSILTLTTLILWAVIRGRPQKFLFIAWLYELLCLLEYASAFIFVPFDELRILWYLVNILGAFILLGRQAVTASIGVSVAISGSQQPLRVIQEQTDTAMYHAKQAGRNRVSVL